MRSASEEQTTRLHQARTGLWWSLRHRQEVRAAIVWLVIAGASRRGVAGIKANAERRRALLGAALKPAKT